MNAPAAMLYTALILVIIGFAWATYGPMVKDQKANRFALVVLALGIAAGVATPWMAVLGL